MKKIIAIALGTLMLSGCALTSTYTIGTDGNVSGTTTFGVPKSSVRNVKTVEQWEQVLINNNFPAPTSSPSPSASASASCGAGEDVELGQWTYTCNAVGDVSVLGEATSMAGSGSLTFERNGKTITILQPPSSSTGEGDAGDNPFGLTGISLFFATTTITFPGEVTTATGGAEKIDDHTVSFSADENQETEMGATVVLADLTSTATSLDLTVNPFPLAAGSADLEFTASLATPAPGQVTFFDGDVTLGKADVDAEGVAKYFAGVQPDGDHTYKAVFQPKDWWNVDKSQDEFALNFKTFQMTNYPRISGAGKVGTTLAITNLKPKPAAAQVSYKWLRDGKVIAGKTGKTYKTISADFNKRITVRVTLRKPGYLPITFDSAAIRITKR